MTKLIVAVRNFANATIEKGSNVMLYMEINECGNTVGNNITHPTLTVKQKRTGVAIKLMDTTQTDELVNESHMCTVSSFLL